MPRTGRPKTDPRRLKLRGSRCDPERKSAKAAKSRRQPRKARKPKVAKSDLGELIKCLPAFDPYRSTGGAEFKPEVAQAVIDWWHANITHVKGELARKPFVLEPWQQSVVANLFGWIKPDGTRRFRRALFYVPRKNGKTPFAAGIILRLLFEDGENGAEVYGAASEYKQASLVFSQAQGMILHNPAMRNACKIFKGQSKAVELESDLSIYRVISSDSFAAHGFNTHGAVVDELHTQPNRELVDALETSTAARRQPLMLYLTTADFARESICNETYQYAYRVRDGQVDDPEFLPVIYEASPGDDWRSPQIWAKANPNLGVSVKTQYIEQACAKAQNSPSFENTFKRLHLNIITEQDVRWLQMKAWEACGGALPELSGKPCFAALDLSTKKDLTALVLGFPLDDSFAMLPWFWLPEDRLQDDGVRNVPYADWARDGLIELTPGSIIDYGHIRNRLLDLSKQYAIQQVAFDPWNATQLAIALRDEDGFDMVEFRQGTKSMSEPMKNFEALVVSGKLLHGDNRVLNWMAGNVTAVADSSDNIRPDKKKSTGRIDGIVAAIMTLGLSMVRGAESTSIYESQGLTFV